MASSLQGKRLLSVLDPLAALAISLQFAIFIQRALFLSPILSPSPFYVSPCSLVNVHPRHSLPTPTPLSRSHNVISDDGAATLSSALAGHMALHELYLRCAPCPIPRARACCAMGIHDQMDGRSSRPQWGAETAMYRNGLAGRLGYFGRVTVGAVGGSATFAQC